MKKLVETGGARALSLDVHASAAPAPPAVPEDQVGGEDVRRGGARAGAFRVMFAGGCHVEGFPIGREHAFPEVTVRELQKQLPCVARCAPQVNLSTAPLLVRECTRFRPDVLVLQLGHYESAIWVTKRARKLLSRSWPREAGASSVETSSHSSKGASRRLWRARSVVRYAGDKLLGVLGQPAYPLSAFAPALGALLREIRRLGISRTYLLCPFPCLDYATRLRRRAIGPCFPAEAEKHGCRYVDVSDELEGSPGSRWSLFADPFHLGVEGHRRIGVKLARAIGTDVMADMTILGLVEVPSTG